MKRLHQNLLILIVLLINFIGIILLSNIESNSTIVSINNPVKDRLETIKEKGVLTVASSNDPPVAFIDSKTKQFTGVDAEIITEIAKRLGINKVNMVSIPFKDLLIQLNNNDNIDLITDGMFITDERKEQVLFTNVWYEGPECVVVPRFSNIVQQEDLKNAVLGVQNGTIYMDLSQKLQKDGLIKSIQTFDTLSDLIFAVNNNKIDALMTDCIPIKYKLLTDKNLYLKVLSPYKPEFHGMVAAAARKSDLTLVDKLNEKLAEMDQDGTLFRIIKKYNINAPI